ncbi:uncharacterized protein LOC131023016 [Salvia miltiorrhiza]|uniref:uncharacterized protein LOC131023016 n=1 Tax=Salvia miltiorrhiza TaxID=226208 RepID=UPI0025ACB4B1|nr:uncharacterized protein LOC131023016 [Salvia miltiorrhiza]
MNFKSDQLGILMISWQGYQGIYSWRMSEWRERLKMKNIRLKEQKLYRSRTTGVRTGHPSEGCPRGFFRLQQKCHLANSALDGQPQQGPKNKLCEYHNAYGNYTRYCGHLMHQLELLVRQGNLDQFIARGNEGQRQPPQRNDHRQDQGNDRDRRPEENRDQHRGAVQGRAPPHPPRREVHMIFGENGIPTSNRAKKQVVRAVRSGYYPKQVMEITGAAEEPAISFGAEDLRTLMYPHDDALVFTTDIASCFVHRVFVDSGSAVNILYLECLQNMGIDANIEPTNAPLFGFGGGEIVMPLGFVELSVTLGRADACKTRMIRFLVVDIPKPSYNVIFGRPALMAFRAVISMFHLKMKFPIGGGRVGEEWGDQKMSKKCHVRMLTHSSGQKRERVVEGPDTRKKGEGREGFQTKIGPFMNEQVKEELISCLQRNANVFAFSTADLKGIDRGLAEHRLNVNPNVIPVKQRTRHFGTEKDAAIREQVHGLLDAGYIEEVQYPERISNAVMVAKKTNTWRMCVDYRDLNAACPKDHYPLPRIDQLVDSTSGCALLSMMDTYQGYHQVKMHREDIAKTAFAVCCGVFGWRSMPFGLKNTGATYQRMMEKIFKEQLSKNISVYMDDMLVRSIRTDDQFSDLEEVFTVIKNHRLMLNPAKCTFGSQLESSWDTRFISRSAERSLPFFKILRKGTKFQWIAECRTAFDDLKAYLAELPTLTKPIPDEVLYLYIAVGEESISSVLIREEGNHQRPIYFVSRVIQGPELNYSEIEKAALAVMVTARKLRPYFLSHRVVVRTALPFRQVLGRPDLSGRMVKWAVELGEYDVEYEPRMAIKAQALADFIQETTRRPVQEFWIAFVDGSVTKEGYGIGVYVVSPSSEVYQFAIKFTCKMSNNEAEYEAVVRAAHILSELRAECVIIRTDSQLVAQQFSGGYHIKEDQMRAYHNKINEMKKKFMEFKIEQISREENTKADLLARVTSAVEQMWSDEITLLCDTREMGSSQVAMVGTRDSGISYEKSFGQGSIGQISPRTPENSFENAKFARGMPKESMFQGKPWE